MIDFVTDVHFTKYFVEVINLLNYFDRELRKKNLKLSTQFIK